MGRLTEQIQQKIHSELLPWAPFLEARLKTESLLSVDKRYTKDKAMGLDIYPDEPNIFSAFAICPPEKVKVVIIGQDPYHGPGEAHGLAFSIRNGRRVQPSLQNIKTELLHDLGKYLDLTGSDLTPWAKQGVFLLNAVLTVKARTPASHAGIGWEDFTTGAIKYLLQAGKGPVVLILWGRKAKDAGREALRQAGAVNRPVAVLESAHPSPYSANAGFFGSRPFSKANAFLSANGSVPINWSIPDTP